MAIGAVTKDLKIMTKHHHDGLNFLPIDVLRAVIQERAPECVFGVLTEVIDLGRCIRVDRLAFCPLRIQDGHTIQAVEFCTQLMLRLCSR